MLQLQMDNEATNEPFFQLADNPLYLAFGEMIMRALHGPE